ncbi:uncharacterized protein PG998_014311 [Apiospora kogelbergensis]|uniref:uncharacterized protein n=1 Tax=Apiospora kogelbergensis TaxID=1337665 RepID=UPI003130813A
MRMADQEEQPHFVTKAADLEDRYERILQSKPVAFLVGTNEEKYVLHSGVVARLSKPLCVLVNGKMKEAQEDCVKWPQVDEKTFIRFSQWAYTGSYLAAEPEIILIPADITTESTHATATSETPPTHPAEEPMPSIPLPPPQPISQQTATSDQTASSLALLLQNARNVEPTNCRRGHVFQSGASAESVCDTCSEHYTIATCAHMNARRRLCLSPKSTMCSKCQGRLRSTKKLQMVKLFDRPHRARTFQPRPNQEEVEEYKEVFLSHARLYVLADIYDVTLLANQVVDNLSTTLKLFTLYKTRIGDFFSLVEYVFLNTQKEDAMRNLLVLYAACTIEELNRDSSLEDFLESCPEFASTLVAKLIGRLD